MMVKVPQEHKQWYIILVISFFVSLVVCILILAAITGDTFFWIVAIVIDLIVIAIGVRTILKMFKPVIISEKIGDVLEYSKESKDQVPPIQPDAESTSNEQRKSNNRRGTYDVYLNQDKIVFQEYQASSTSVKKATSSSVTVNSGVWNCIGVSYDVSSGSVIFFNNGSSETIASSNSTGGNLGVDQSRIGYCDYVSKYVGDMGLVGIGNALLTVSNFNEIYNSGNGIPYLKYNSVDPFGSLSTVKLVQGGMKYKEEIVDNDFVDSGSTTATVDTSNNKITFTSGQIFQTKAIDVGTTLGNVTAFLGSSVGTFKIEVSSDDKTTWQTVTKDVKTPVTSSDGTGTYVRITENGASSGTIQNLYDSFGQISTYAIELHMEE